MGAEESGPLDSRRWELISFARLRMQGFDFDPPTTENVGQGSGFSEDALVVGLVGGDDVVGAEIFLGAAAGDFAHFPAAPGADPKRNRQPQDPGSQTEPGAPSVCFCESKIWLNRAFPSSRAPQASRGSTGRPRREKRGPSTAQPNHLTGSEMGRVKLGCFGRDDRFWL